MQRVRHTNFTFTIDSVSDEGMRLAISAALNAWPNQNIFDDDVVYVECGIILPLTQENTDA